MTNSVLVFVWASTIMSLFWGFIWSTKDIFNVATKMFYLGSAGFGAFILINHYVNG